MPGSDHCGWHHAAGKGRPQPLGPMVLGWHREGTVLDFVVESREKSGEQAGHNFIQRFLLVRTIAVTGLCLSFTDVYVLF